MLDLPYIVTDVDRKGTVRVYFRRNDRKIRLRAKPGTDEFLSEYQAAMAGREWRGRHSPRPDTFAWLCRAYYASAEFRRLGDRTQTIRRRILDGIAIKDGARLYAEMEQRHVRARRDERADKPEAANAIVKALRQLYGWAIEAGHAQRNPARDVPYLRSGNPEGFHPWTVEEVAQYEARHPIGTKANLALSLLLFTGVRRSDVVKLGRQMARNGWLRWRETKGARRVLKERAIPVLPALQAAIDGAPTGDLTYLVTQFGRPFTANGFGNWFRKRCNEAGLPQCSAHGLRKAGATVAAENGATEHQLMAIYGWESPKQAALYTRKANRAKLAGEAMRLIALERKPDDQCPTQTESGTISVKSAKIQ